MSETEKEVEHQDLKVGVDISPKAKAKADKETAMVAEFLGKHQSELGQTWYANGIKMMKEGEATFGKMTREIELLPLLKAGLGDFIKTIVAEQRRDYDVKLNTLSLDQKGVLVGANGGIHLNERAWQMLAGKCPEALDKVVPGSLKSNFNLWLPHADKEVKIRTRNPLPDGSKQAFYVAGPRYGVCDVDSVAEMLMEKMPADARVNVRYDGSRTSFEVTIPAPFVVNELGVGRAHHIMVVIQTSDDGTVPLIIFHKATRVRCVNCTTIMDESLTFRRRHVGNDVKEVFDRALGRSGVAAKKFSEMWEEGNKRMLLDRVTGEDLAPEECIKRLIACEYIKIPRVKNYDLFNMLMSAYEVPEQEGLNKGARISAAISYVANHRSDSWKSPWYVDELEETAGVVLNLVLDREFSGLPSMSEETEKSFLEF